MITSIWIFLVISSKPEFLPTMHEWLEWLGEFETIELSRDAVIPFEYSTEDGLDEGTLDHDGM